METSGPVGVEHLAETRPEIGADELSDVRRPADQRHLRHHGPHPPIDGADHEHVPARVAAPPDPDPGGVDLVEGGGVGDGVAVVAHLLPGVDLLTRLAVARAEVAVVEHERVQARRGEHLGEGVEVHLLDRGEPVRHHDGGSPPGHPLPPVQPPSQGDALGVELDVATIHDGLPTARLRCRRRR